MPNHRPTSDVIAARRWEIKRRYARKQGKVGKRTRSMAAIRLAELTRWLHATRGRAELEASEQSFQIVRIFAHHLGGLSDTARRITSWLGDYAPWIKGADRERLIAEVTACPLKFSADKLAWKIRLTDTMRTELKIRTIGAIDCSREQRAARRKEQRAALMRALRAKRKADRVNSI